MSPRFNKKVSRNVEWCNQIYIQFLMKKFRFGKWQERSSFSGLDIFDVIKRWIGSGLHFESLNKFRIYSAISNKIKFGWNCIMHTVLNDPECVKSKNEARWTEVAFQLFLFDQPSCWDIENFDHKRCLTKDSHISLRWVVGTSKQNYVF